MKRRKLWAVMGLGCVLVFTGCTSIRYGPDGFVARSLFSDKSISGFVVTMDENGKPKEIRIDSYVNSQAAVAGEIARGVAAGASPL